MRRLIVAVIAVVLGSLGCAHDVHVRYPAAPEEATGTIVLRLASSASGVSVAVDGMLVVEDAHTERIVIAGIPAGTRDIVMTANGSDKQLRVWVGTDHATTIPLGVPDGSTGFVRSLIGTLITIVVYSIIH